MNRNYIASELVQTAKEVAGYERQARDITARINAKSLESWAKETLRYMDSTPKYSFEDVKKVKFVKAELSGRRIFFHFKIQSNDYPDMAPVVVTLNAVHAQMDVPRHWD